MILTTVYKKPQGILLKLTLENLEISGNFVLEIGWTPWMCVCVLCMMFVCVLCMMSVCVLCMLCVLCCACCVCCVVYAVCV